MSERCPRCENDRFGAMVRSLWQAYERDLAQLDARGAAHTCPPVENPPAPAPEPEPPADEPTPPHPDPSLAPVAKRPRKFDWEV